METQNTPKTGLIYKKMADMMADIGAVEKSGTNKFQNYKYRGIEDVYNALHPLLGKYGIFLKLKILDLKREERTNDKNKAQIYSLVTVEYIFTCEDGSSVSSTCIGEAFDSSDKSLQKALSAAQKYLFFQMFCIPTEEQKPEIEEVEQFVKPKKSAQKQPQKPINQTISKGQRTALWAMCKTKWTTEQGVEKTVQIPNETVKQIIGAHGYESTNDIKIDDYEMICAKLKQKLETLKIAA